LYQALLPLAFAADVPRADGRVERAFHVLAELTPAEARHLAGNRARFRVVLDSTGEDSFEAENSFFRAAWLSSGKGVRNRFRSRFLTSPGRRGDCSPRLPQIRTCAINASGSSCHSFAA
jgi:hypothetical protein